MIITENTFDINKIKLIIWDLDNTFWNGVISEGSIAYDNNNIDLLKQLNSRGIVNSICSKNDYEVCKKELISSGLWEYFVFSSIDWSDKGQRVFDIINNMKLRPENVLFLDDEPSNLHRALSINDALMCGSIQSLQSLLLSNIEAIPLKEDGSRLKKYQELEKKTESKKLFSSDLDFLEQSEIFVSIKRDCESQIDRIYELINRTNQLNYTKKRLERQDTEDLIADKKTECGYIECSDKYSNYGIVGFFALNKKNKVLEHFLFSCRTIGMGIEQYVYAQLGYPDLRVVGEVVTVLSKDDCPKWINKNGNKRRKDRKHSTRKVKILVKGPCDVSQITPYFSGGELTEEFAYVSEKKRGMFIESFNHTSQILYAYDLSEQDKQFLYQTVPFIDKDFFTTRIFTERFDYVILSMLTDYSLGLYQSQSRPDFIVPFGQYTTDYTDREKWENIQKILTNNQRVANIVSEEYEQFHRDFKYVGRITDEQLLTNLKRIRNLLPNETNLILLNGAEREYTGECKPSHINRHILHQHLNKIVASFVQEHSDNCYMVDVNTFMDIENPYLDTINHYKKDIYYKIANEIQREINATSNSKLKTKSSIMLKAERFLNRIKIKR